MTGHNDADRVVAAMAAVAAGRIPDRSLDGLVSVDQVRQVLDLHAQPLGTELLGRREVEVHRYAAESHLYESGLLVYADAEGDVVLVAGFNPADPSGDPLACDEAALAPFGQPALVLDAALGRVMLTGAERVWPERGLAVRTNPGNGLLLALMVFAPTDPEAYLAELRPDAERRQLLAGVSGERRRETRP